MKSLTFLMLFLLSGATTSANESFRYVAGSDPAARFSLMILTPGKYCTGTLIAPDIALIGAHCLGSKELEADKIRIVFSAAVSPTFGYAVSHICRGEKFAINPLWGTFNNIGTQPGFDMGLVKFTCRVPSQSQPITLDYDKVEALTSLSFRGGMLTKVLLFR